MMEETSCALSGLRFSSTHIMNFVIIMSCSGWVCDVLSIPPTTVTWSYDFGGVQRNLTTDGRVTISPSTTLTITNVQELKIALGGMQLLDG